MFLSDYGMKSGPWGVRKASNLVLQHAISRLQSHSPVIPALNKSSVVRVLHSLSVVQEAAESLAGTSVAVSVAGLVPNPAHGLGRSH